MLVLDINICAIEEPLTHLYIYIHCTLDYLKRLNYTFCFCIGLVLPFVVWILLDLL